MIKISKIKYICIFTLLFSLIFLSSCKIKNDYKTYEDGLVLTINEDLQEYFLYKEAIPSLKFEMNNVNVSVGSNNSNYVLVENDFTVVSDAWGSHLSRYSTDNIVIISCVEQTSDKNKAKFGGVEKKLDDVDEFGNPQKYSKEVRLVAWEMDGTRYSYQFRTFVSEGKRYYAFCYATSLTMTIEQPLMVVKNNNQNRLLLLPLPYDTKYEVSGSTLTIDSLINKNTYLDSKYYHFAYPSSLDNLLLEEKIERVRSWYETYCNGKIENDKFIIEYSGAKFSVEFNTTKQDPSTGKHNPGFALTYIGPKD